MSIPNPYLSIKAFMSSLDCVVEVDILKGLKVKAGVLEIV
jgi:hypothetical protein